MYNALSKCVFRYQMLSLCGVCSDTIYYCMFLCISMSKYGSLQSFSISYMNWISYLSSFRMVKKCSIHYIYIIYISFCIGIPFIMYINTQLKTVNENMKISILSCTLILFFNFTIHSSVNFTFQATGFWDFGTWDFRITEYWKTEFRLSKSYNANKRQSVIETINVC